MSDYSKRKTLLSEDNLSVVKRKWLRVWIKVDNGISSLISVCAYVCVCVCVVQPLSFVIFLLAAAELLIGTSGSADISPVEEEQQLYVSGTVFFF